MMDYEYKAGKYLLLWGGIDVNPALYEQKPYKYTQKPNLKRDMEEVAAFTAAVKEGIPIIGVCRGAQLTCVMNGGALWQHSLHHNTSHGLVTPLGNTIPNCDAGHHQIMDLRGTKDFSVLAFAPFPTPVWNDKEDTVLIEAPEIVYFPKTRSLAIQPHPEWAQKTSPFRIYIDQLVKNLFNLEGVF